MILDSDSHDEHDEQDNDDDDGGDDTTTIPQINVNNQLSEDSSENFRLQKAK